MSEISLKCKKKNMNNWYVLNVLYEMLDDESLGIKTCSNVESHLLNWDVFDWCVFMANYVNIVIQWDDSE